MIGRRTGSATRHQRRAEQAADQRRHVGGAERAAGLAAPRHRIAVERGRRRCRMAGRAEQDGGDRVGGGGGGAEAEQQRKRRRRIEIVGEGQQQRRAGDAADARQDAERQAHAHAGEQIEHAHRVEDDEQRTVLPNAACPLSMEIVEVVQQARNHFTFPPARCRQYDMRSTRTSLLPRIRPMLVDYWRGGQRSVTEMPGIGMCRRKPVVGVTRLGWLRLAKPPDSR